MASTSSATVSADQGYSSKRRDPKEGTRADKREDKQKAYKRPSPKKLTSSTKF